MVSRDAMRPPPRLRPHHVMLPSGPGSMLLLAVLSLSFLLVQPSPPLKPQVCRLLQEASQVTPSPTHLTLLIASAAYPDSWAPLRPRAKTGVGPQVGCRGQPHPHPPHTRVPQAAPGLGPATDCCLYLRHFPLLFLKTNSSSSSGTPS